MTPTIPTDAPSVFEALSTLVLNGEQLALVRPDNPPPGIAGFLFDLPGKDGFELESDITDNFVEDNSAIQDHIALHPEVVTISGDTAELVYIAPATSPPVAPRTQPLPLIDKITTQLGGLAGGLIGGFGIRIDGLVPTLTPAALAKMDAAFLAAENNRVAIDITQTLYGYYNSRLPQQPNQTKQSRAFGFLYQLWKGRQLFTVETPWGFTTNMAIQSVSVEQDEKTKQVSHFDITFKKIRTARTISVTPGLLAGRSVFQYASVSQNGTIGQVPVTSTQAGSIVSKMVPTP